MKSDYYDVLGINKNANEKEIKKAYKRLAIKFHPDRNPGNSSAEENFKKIKEAYEVLIDPKKRSAYDRYGQSAFDQGNMGDNGFSYSSVNTADFGDIFGDVFGDIFGTNSSNRNENRRSSGRGYDIQYDLELTLEEAVKGAVKEIKVPSMELCSFCKGTGSKSRSSIVNCSTCHGRGQIQIRQGFFTIQQTCPVCKGEGKMIKDPCRYCGSLGKVEKVKYLSIKVPSGVDNGDRIRLAGKGKISGRGSSEGDLYVNIKICKHNIFNRDGNDLYCEIPIDFAMAALGGEIDVPILDGRIKLKIPSETQTGRMFRIRGKGVRSLKNNRIGDLLCKIVVETPVRLNGYQKKLLMDLSNSFRNFNGDSKNSPRSKNFFDGIRKFFEDLTK